jgi:hypothetical protein
MASLVRVAVTAVPLSVGGVVAASLGVGIHGQEQGRASLSPDPDPYPP